MIRAIVGSSWGDEGKGKITDLFAKKADVIVRFQGGSNAGHTIINEYGKFALHQLPSGIFNKNAVNIIGNGMALNIEYLMNEIKTIKDKNIDFNLIISNRAGVVLPHHIMLDTYEEERLQDKKFGSTKSGIAPFYSDKFSKIALQVWELYEDDYLLEKLKSIYEKINVQIKYLYNKPLIDYKEVYDNIKKQSEFIKPYVCDTNLYLKNAIKENKNILLEGQLGALKDTDNGIYPYVTSSSTLAGYASVGAGIPPYLIKNITVITKAYSSAVGEGPFVSEIFGDEASELRERGGDSGEYGATTGRPRRVGYFDVVATRYGCEIQGATEVCMTCVDVLSYMEKIKICTAYEFEGKIYNNFLNTQQLYKAKPIIKELDGWKTDIKNINEYDDLPENTKKFIEFIEKEIGVKISMISNGPNRNNIIFR